MSKGFGCMCASACVTCAFLQVPQISFLFFILFLLHSTVRNPYTRYFHSESPTNREIIQVEKCVRILQLEVCVHKGEVIYICPVVRVFYVGGEGGWGWVKSVVSGGRGGLFK